MRTSKHVAALPWVLVVLSAWVGFANRGLAADPAPLESSPAEPARLLLISVDTLRADAVGAAGAAEPSADSATPHLDRFARDAVVFQTAYAQSPHTLPSHVSLFTGRQPIVHRVLDGETRLASGVPTLPSILAEAGWSASGVVSNFYLDERFGFARGFERYVRLDETLQHADAVLERGRAEIDRLEAARRGGAPWLLFLHFMDPHSDPRTPTSTTPYFADAAHYREADWPVDDERFCAGRACATDRLRAHNRGTVIDAAAREQVRRHYLAGVRETDAALGTLFDALRERGLYDSLWIVIVSDHGEALGEARQPGSERTEMLHRLPAEHTLRVPLMIKQPQQRGAGRRIADVVQLVDLLPTLLAALDVPPVATDGQDLSSRLSEPERAESQKTDRDETSLEMRGRAILQGAPYPGGGDAGTDLWALREGRWKLVHRGRTDTSRLFDLVADPHETRNLASQHPERVAALRQALLDELRALRRQRASIPGPERAAPASVEARRRLEALGYAGGGS